MTLSQFTSHQIDDLGRQLDAVLGDLDDATSSIKPGPEGMSAREIVAHLGDCYSAVIHEANAGHDYAWGSYTPPAGSFQDQWSAVKALRGQAKGLCTADDSDEKAKSAHAYIVAHDAYHVGQMALARLAADPTWDAYSIYS